MRRRRPWFLALIAAWVVITSSCARIESRPDPLPAATLVDSSLALAENDLDRARVSVSPREAARRYYSAASRASALVFGSSPVDDTTYERARQIHNVALARFLRLSRGPRRAFDDAWLEECDERGVPLALRANGAVWNPDRFDRLEFASDHSAFPLREVAAEPGLGVPMFSVRRRKSNDFDRLQGNERFLPPVEVYPVTAVLRNPGTGETPLLELRDPLRSTWVESPGGSIPLAADFSTPLAYHFSITRLPLLEQVARLDPNQLEWSAGLHMLHPYEPGKIPIVFIHGYWSSPRCWLQAINELRRDPTIRSRYQFWIYMYPSINSHLHSAALLRRSLREVREVFDPARTDPALGRMVLVGHSMGGLLAKTAVQDSGDSLWSLVSPRRFQDVTTSEANRGLLEEVFFFRADPNVARVVFIATPHRGSYFSNPLFGRISGRLTPHPGPLTRALNDLRRANPPQAFSPLFRGRGLSMSFDQLRVGDPVLERLDRIPVVPGVRVHSIIAQKHKGPVELGTDGVVAHASSHLEGVESERIIDHHHFCQQEPETVAELKRILWTSP